MTTHERIAEIEAMLQRHHGITPEFEAITWLIEQLREARKDSARLDWFETKREAIASPDGETHVANAWGLYAQQQTLRAAIDDALQAASERSDAPDDELRF